MTKNAEPQLSKEDKRCPYCSKPIETPHPREIIDRGWDSNLRRQYVRRRTLDFCSTICGGNYQMGCEG